MSPIKLRWSALWRLAAAFCLMGLPATPAVHAAEPSPPPPDPIARRDLEHLVLPETATDPGPADAPAAAQVLPWTQVAFQSYRNNNWEIYTGNDDGTNEHRLTDNAKSDIQPQLRRGDLRAIFASNRDGDYEIYAVNYDGSGLQQLTFNNTDDVGPVWSPDGGALAFESYRDGQAEVYRMNADGSGQTRLTNSADYDGQPAWSPSGAQLAFASRRTGGYRIYVMSATGGAALILSGQAYSEHPTWSPDGNTIAYDADGTGDGWQEIWLMQADGSNQHSYLDYGSQSDTLVSGWSPDGRYITFTEVDYIFYQGSWYWASAYAHAYNTVSGATAELSSASVDWAPHWQTLDTTAPASHLAALPATSPSPVSVSWSATDQGGSGPHTYDVDVRDGAGPWTPWQTQVTTTAAQYPGLGGHSYAFRVRARDWAYNAEPMPNAAGAATTVEALPPTSAVLALPAFARGPLTVAWAGVDPGGSGIGHFDVQYRSGAAGVWVNWWPGTTTTDATFGGVPGLTYYFRARAQDRAANQEDWPGGDGDTHTSYYSWQTAGTLQDAAGRPIALAGSAVTPNLVGSLPSDSSGRYALYGVGAIPAYTAGWSKPGYGSLPSTVLSTTQDNLWNLVLPPANNAVQNWGFETAGLSGWSLTGPATATTHPHTGAQAARLGSNQAFAFGDLEVVGSALAGFGNGGDPGFPSIAVDSHGTVHAVWSGSTNGGQVFYSSRPLGGGWASTIILSPASFGDQPSIAIDGQDTVHVVWRGEGLIYASKSAGGAWSAATPISSGGAYYRPHLVASAAGNLYLAWLEYHSPYVGESAINFIYKPAGGAWSSGEQAFWHSGLQASDPHLTLGPDGTVYLTCLCVSGYVLRSPTGGWSDVVTLGGGQAYSVGLTVDATGTLHAIWASGVADHALMYANRPPNGVWSPPRVAVPGTPGSDVYETAVASANGQVWAAYVWRPNDSSTWRVYSVATQPGGGWSMPALMDTANFGTSPRLVIEPGGAPHLVMAVGGTGIGYRGPVLADAPETAAFSQTVTIPLSEGTPTLSFLYELSNGYAPAGAGLWASLNDTPILSITVGTGGWQHATADLSAWAGQTVSLTIATRQIAGRPPVFALVDEVSIGSAYPDVWVQASDGAGVPGQVVDYVITYGNQGAAPAAGVTLSFTLPAQVDFLSSQPPAGPGPTLNWDIGLLPAHSGPYTLTVIGQIKPTVITNTNWPHSLAALSTSLELELDNNTLLLTTHVLPYQLRLPLVRR